MNTINKKIYLVENLAIEYKNKYIIIKNGKYGWYLQMDDFKCSVPEWAIENMNKNELIDKDILIFWNIN